MTGRLRWTAAILVSLLVHLALWWEPPRLWQAQHQGSPLRAAEQVTRVAFRPAPPQPAAEPPPVEPAPVEPPPKPVEPPVRPPDPVEPPKPLPKPVERPKRSERVKPVEPKPSPMPAPQPAPAAPSRPVEASAPAAALAASAPDPAKVAAVREAYLGRLVARLDAAKFYPEAARRRRLTGVVPVSFRLHRDGTISDLAAAGGPALLQQAALEAVRRAVPLPPVPEEIETPLAVSYGMEFRLN